MLQLINYTKKNLGMNLKTAQQIIWRYKKSGTRAPKLRGGPNNVIYDREEIISFLVNFYFYHIQDDITLEQLQKELFFEGLQVPSVSWIEKALNKEKISLKKLSISPFKRNTIKVIEQRREYVLWRTLVNDGRLISFDEHSFNLWLKRQHGRSKVGLECYVERPTQRNIVVSIPIAITLFGKILCTPFVGAMNRERFDIFLSSLKMAWYNSDIIPNNIKVLGPILLLDSLTSHSKILLEKHNIEYRKYPVYSPFLNETEYVNNVHKSMIKKYLREHSFELVELEFTPKYGEKMKKRVQYMIDVCLITWAQISNKFVSNIYKHVMDTYFSRCYDRVPIHK